MTDPTYHVIIGGLKILRKIDHSKAVGFHMDDVKKMINLLRDASDLSWLEENSWKVVEILEDALKLKEEDLLMGLTV